MTNLKNLGWGLVALLSMPSIIAAQIGMGTNAPQHDLHIRDTLHTELAVESDSVKILIGVKSLESTSSGMIFDTLEKNGAAYFISEDKSLPLGGDLYPLPDKLIFGARGNAPLYFGTNNQIDFSIRPDHKIYAGGYSSLLNEKFNVNGTLSAANKFSLYDPTLTERLNIIQTNTSSRMISRLLFLKSEFGVFFTDSSDISLPYAFFDSQKESLVLGPIFSHNEDKLNVAGSIYLTDTLKFAGDDHTLFKNGDQLDLTYTNYLKFIGDGTTNTDIHFINEDSLWMVFDGNDKSVEIDGDLEVNGNLFSIGLNDFENDANLRFRPFTNFRIINRGQYDTEIGSRDSIYFKCEGLNRRVAIGYGNIPETTLDVKGTTKTDTLSIPTDAADGYVLTSDATGIASWQPGPSDSDWEVIGNNMKTIPLGNVQIGTGTGTPTSKLEVQGSFSLPIDVIPSPTYMPGINDHTLIFTAGSGADITLPAASSAEGRIYVFKFMTVASSKVIAVVPDKIDNSAVFNVPPPSTGLLSASVMVQSDGVNWWVLNY